MAKSMPSAPRPSWTRANRSTLSAERTSVIRGASARGLLGLAPLGVEDPERVAVDLGPVVLGEVVAHVLEELAQARVVGDSVGRAAHRVHHQQVALRPERPQVTVGEGDDLDVDVGVVDAERLDADLVVLAEPALLRLLVPERRGDVPRLPRRDRPVLDEGPDHAGRALGAQRERDGRPCPRSRTSPW